jgi:transposase
MENRKKPRNFSDEFKKQMVQLYENGKRRCDIIREYDLTPSAFGRWVKQYRTTGSFAAKDNRSIEEQEVIDLRKENQQLRMENDILKQAALIMGRG